MRTAAPLLLPLFRSAGQAAVLSTIFLSEREMSAADVAHEANLSYPTVWKEVRELLNAGLLTQRRVGQTRMLSPDEGSPFVRPLRELLELAFGAVSSLSGALGPVAGIDAVAIFGSYADRVHGRGGAPPGDIDVLIVGNPDVAAVYAACTSVARRQRRPVNPTILTLDEWRSDEPFVVDVRRGALLPVLGDVTALATS